MSILLLIMISSSNDYITEHNKMIAIKHLSRVPLQGVSACCIDGNKNTHIHTSKWIDGSYEMRAQCASIIWVTLCLCVAQPLHWDTQMIETYTVYKNTHEHIHIYEHILTVMWFNHYHGVCRGEICHCRHCRRLCKFFIQRCKFLHFHSFLLCYYLQSCWNSAKLRV